MTQANTPGASGPPGALKTPVDRLITRLARRFGGGQSKEVERFIKFSFVGALGFVIDFGAVILLQATVLPAESDSNVALVSTIAFVLAVCNNFLWNRYWTYPDSRAYSIRRQITQFAIVSVIGLALRNLWIGGTYAFFGEQSTRLLQSVDAGYAPGLVEQNSHGTLIALVFGVLIVMFWNFLANRYWTYSDID